MKIITSWIDGAWSAPAGAAVNVLGKYSGAPIAQLHQSSSGDVERAIAAAERAFTRGRLPISERVAVLNRVAVALTLRSAEFACIISAEGGSTIGEATKEVERAIITLKATAEESTRIDGDIIPLEGAPGGEEKFAFMLRHPLGVVCAITAFNSPLNTPIHKIAPAIAAGNSVVLKPPSVTPVSSALLCEIFAEAGLPPGWLNYVVGSGATVGEQLLHDERIAFYHFTGSTAVGRRIARTIGLRRSCLELGSIAATILLSDADIGPAIKDIARAGYAKAGQVCTSTQVLYVEATVVDEVRDALSDAVRRLSWGDPALPSTQVGPLISSEEADRVTAWIDRALAGGARRLTGGGRDRAVLEPNLVTDVPENSSLLCEEVFGPVVSLVPVGSLDEAIARYNAGSYGLAAGVFTRDIQLAFNAVRRLRTGTLHVNAASSSRLDAMPFGGIKNSGHGKEGPRWAIQEMSEQRLTILHGV